ncbi:golgin subfamily A member 5-like [Littorina saxatilis]|uniref:Golgin-84 n=1 Tax=Littorina saxatilis TaxID=31220 RepID=A0AAN9BER6_9CAEN
MSWLTAVTGKAEDFLNKLDRSAADAFHLEAELAGQKPIIASPVVSEQLSQSASPGARPYSVSPSVSVPSRLSDTSRFGQPKTTSTPKITSSSTPKPTLKPSGSATTGGAAKTVSGATTAAAATSKPLQLAEVKKKDSDEALFDFLNSKDTTEGNKKRGTPISSRHHSRQSSTSSLRGGSKAPEGGEEIPTGEEGGGRPSSGSTATASAPQAPVAESAETETQPAASHRSSPTGSNESADIEALEDAMKESPAASDHSAPESETHDVGHTNVSSLELENRLLKNEVTSLNQEMASIIQRAKNAQSELVKTKEKMNDYVNSSSLHDQLVRELQAREMDLQEALKAKDSQLAVLRVRLEESERAATSKLKEVESLQTDRERILHDQSSASGMHSQTLDTMRHKLAEMEATLAREQQAHKHYQQEAAERQSRLEQEQKALADALTAAEKKVTEEKAKAAEAYGQLKTMKATLEAARLEITEYKEKASRILQSKERLIASLRDGSATGGSAEGVSSLEYDSVRQERDMLREELQKSKMTADNLRMELQDLESQMQQENSTAQDNIQSLEDSLAEEKRRKEDVEQELLKRKQEQQYAIEELHRQKASFQSRISDREAEIEKLRNQLTTKSISSTSESELESRVRSLTESLIQKQTTLEALSTEKNSLTLQLERLGQQYRDVENSLMRSTVASVNVGDHDDDVRQRLPTFMREGVTDTEVTRRVKHYVNTIDKFSIRLGVFLRRYPIARVFVIIYMAMLHVWVMVVLMTYQPEIHGKDFLPSEHDK